MNLQLKQQFIGIENQRTVLLKKIESLSWEQLNRHEPGKWSLNQVFAHLIVSEHLSMKYIKKKIQGIDTLADTGLPEQLKMVALILSQRLPLKFKAPGVVVDQTPVYENTAQIIQAWNETRTELEQLLEVFSEKQLKRKVYRHPAVGLLNIRQALRFFSEHIIHHQPQIKSLLKNI